MKAGDLIDLLMSYQNDDEIEIEIYETTSGHYIDTTASISIVENDAFVAVCLRLREETAVPLVQAEWGIRHHYLEFHQSIVFNILRVGEGIALPDSGIVHTVQEHIHGAKRPSLLIVLI